MFAGDEREVETLCLSFLAMFLARAHRTLYRPQSICALAEELGFSTEESARLTRELMRRGFLREFSALAGDGPMMEITPRGIAAVREDYLREIR